MGAAPSKSPSKHNMLTSPTINKEISREMEETQTENKAFISTLVQGGHVDMQKVTMSLWTHRSDPEYIGLVCSELSKLIGKKPILDQVEFYLPQLAHMVLHLEHELPISAIEQFIMMVSQNSIHFALQFFWIIYAALDENRPKTNGKTAIFMRCTQLLLTLEQCIVYGSPVARQAQVRMTVAI